MKRPGEMLAIVFFLLGATAAPSMAQIQPATPMKGAVPRKEVVGYDSRIEDAAKQMAETLTLRKVKSVVVLDFSGVNIPPALGARLATEFSKALAAGSDIPVENRQSVADALQRNQMTSANIRSNKSESWLARQVGTDAFIRGTVGYGIGGLLHLALTAYRTANSDQLAIADAAVPVTPDLRALMEPAGNLSSESLPHQENQPLSGPSCEYCPQPQYTSEAWRHKIEGEALLEFTVDVDGSIKDIQVLAGMPYGLTESAVDTVKHWRLKPAVGSDGKPVVARQSVELTFYRYEQP